MESEPEQISAEEPGALAARAVQGSLQSVAASLLTLAFGFTRAVLLARLLLPEHFGVVALALFYIGLAARLRALSLDLAIIHHRDSDSRFLSTYFTLRLGVDTLAAAILLAGAPLLQRFYPQMGALREVLWVLVAANFMANLGQVQETFLRKNLAFGALARIDVIASAVMTIVAPYLAWQGWGVWALVAEHISGVATRFLLSWLPYRTWRPRFGWHAPSARKLWRYGKPAWMVTNLFYLLDTFDDFWVGTTLGQNALGFYAKAYDFARYPRRVFANPLVTVFMPIFARLQTERERLSRAFYRSAHFILRTGFLIAGGFALIMPEFITQVIGEKWLPMLWTFRLLLIYTALDPLMMLVGNLFLALGRPEVLRGAALIQTLFFLPAVALGASLGGINGVALAADGMVLLGLGLLYRRLREVVDFSLWRLAGWPTVAFLIAAAVGLVVEQRAPGPVAMVLLYKSTLFVLLFGLILVVAERGDYFRGGQQIWRIVRDRKNRGA